MAVANGPYILGVAYHWPESSILGQLILMCKLEMAMVVDLQL